MPIFQTPWLSFLRIPQISIDWIPRTGSVMVTLLIVLSGFCLYLPYARNQFTGEPVNSIGLYFKKRVARIVPSYLFCIIVILIYNIATNQYAAYGTDFMLKDIFSHLTFTFNLFEETNSGTLLNGVLWTVCLEVQFYIFFPLLQYCFRKKPVITYIIMNLISLAYTFYVTGLGEFTHYMHQFPAYLGVYANGFMGATIFVGIATNFKRDKYLAIFSTIVSISCMYVYYLMMKTYISCGNVRLWHMNKRFAISILFLIFILSTSFAVPMYRKLFSNRIAKFISTISFNLYMWHQFLCLTFKFNRIPYYEGDRFPNEIGDEVWKWKLFILTVVTSLLAAIFTTYCIEKPCSKLIMNFNTNKASKHTNS